MTPMRDAWTDERLDDLNERVSEGFRQQHADMLEVNRRIDSVERSVGELRDGSGSMREQIGLLRGQGESIQKQLEMLIRTLQIGSAFLAVILAAILGMIATQL